LQSYNRNLYIGMLGGTNEGDIFVSTDNGSTWSMSYDNENGSRIHRMAVYNGKLYAGNGNDLGQNDVLVFDGVDWAISFDGTDEREVFTLYEYNGALYAGMGYLNGMATVYRLIENPYSQLTKSNKFIKENFNNPAEQSRILRFSKSISTVGNITVGQGNPAEGTSVVSINKPTGDFRSDLRWTTNDVMRWRLSSAGTETGSGNAGSDLYLQSVDDSGSEISGGTMFFERATKRIGLGWLWPEVMQAHVQVRGLGTTTGINFLTESSSGTDGLAVLDNGNVGIGNTAPTAKLHVAGGILPAKVTADPCGTGYPEGTFFYNDTSNYFCYCDGTNDVQMHDPSTACF
jgi:hypothetical protein